MPVEGTSKESIRDTADCLNVSEVRSGTVSTITVLVDDSDVRETRRGKVVQTVTAHDSTGIITIQVWEKTLDLLEGCAYRFDNCRFSFSSYLNCVSATYDGPAPDIVKDHGIVPLFDVMLGSAVPAERISQVGDDAVIHGTVTAVFEPLRKGRGPKTSGLIDVGKKELRFFSWDPVRISEGDEVCMDHIRAERYRGDIQLQITSRSTICRRCRSRGCIRPFPPTAKTGSF